MQNKNIYLIFSTSSYCDEDSISFKFERAYTSRLSAFSHCQLMNKLCVSKNYDFVEVPLFGDLSFCSELNTLKDLADNLYRAASYIKFDASKLHKAMEDYHHFVITHQNIF